MSPLLPVLFAFAVGLTACGLAGSVMELTAGRQFHHGAGKSAGGETDGKSEENGQQQAHL